MKRLACVLALLVIASYFLFFRLGSYGLLETTDARYAEISWEMFQSRDFITPRFDFIKHFHKPPFTYWITALGYYVLGENEWGARFFLGVFGLLTLGGVYCLARLAFNEVAAAFSVLILLTMLGFLAVTHVLATDLYLLFFTTLAMYCFLRWEQGKNSLLWGWAVLGLSTLVKGPVAPILVGVTCSLYLIFTGQFKRLRDAQVGKGLIIFFLFALPWYGWVCLHNKGLFTYFIRTQFFSRIETGTMGHPHPWYYYLLILPGLTFPWTFYLFPALGRSLRYLNRMHFFFLLWALVPFILFSFMRTKLPFYILPCLPPLAILLGEWWNNIFKESTPFSRLAQRLMIFLCFAITLAAISMAIPLWHGRGNILEWQQLKTLWLGETFAFVALTLLLYYSHRIRHQLLHFAALMGISYVFLFPLIWYGNILPINTYRILGEQIYQLEGPDDIVVQYKCYLRSLPFYVKRPTVLVDIPRETQFEENNAYKEIVIDTETFWKQWEGEKRLFCVVPKRILSDFMGKHYYVVAQRRKYIVITNQPLGMNEADKFSLVGNSPFMFLKKTLNAFTHLRIHAFTLS
ncbi:MAG: glycosyltransferase family 39 protein [Candidatus Desulfofervidaceae bacterium]|nr:glycosyltransferase family 39 protein [Candidatus Desulfofervidaceae bacterium]